MFFSEAYSSDSTISLMNISYYTDLFWHNEVKEVRKLYGMPVDIFKKEDEKSFWFKDGDPQLLSKLWLRVV